MLDVIVVGGFTDMNADDSFALESPFLLNREKKFCDILGMYQLLVDPTFSFDRFDYEAPPYVCYALKQLLANQGISSEMIFYLDWEIERLEEIMGIDCRAILLSTTFLASKTKLKAAVDVIKRYKPDTPIIVGGPLIDRSWKVFQKLALDKNATNYFRCSEDLLFLSNNDAELESIDLFIIGDPSLEIASRVITRIKKGECFDSVLEQESNCSTVKNGKWAFSKHIAFETPIVTNIEWDMFRDDEMRSTVPMIGSKGCPNKCRFCNFQTISKYQTKPLNTIEHELDILFKTHSKVKRIYFCDDNICGNRKSINELVNYLSEIDHNFNWYSFFDARFIDLELAEKLKYSGCVLLKIGMESASDTILKNMKKPCRVVHYKKAVGALTEVGISLDTYFIVGYPGETSETIEESIENINDFATPKTSANQMIFFPFVLAPLSPVFENTDRNKYRLTGYMYDWIHDTMDSKTAINWIPQIVSNIKTLQPMHANLDKILFTGSKNLFKIDALRGKMVRRHLAEKQELKSDWSLMRNLLEEMSNKIKQI